MLAFTELPIERQTAHVRQLAVAAAISDAAARAIVETLAADLLADADTELEETA